MPGAVRRAIAASNGLAWPLRECFNFRNLLLQNILSCLTDAGSSLPCLVSTVGAMRLTSISACAIGLYPSMPMH
eukprot:scaffold317064_cov22-Tisochrysis_lutea.AAC.1